MNKLLKPQINKGEYVAASDIPGVGCKWTPSFPRTSIVGMSLQDLEYNEEIKDLKIVIKKSI